MTGKRKLDTETMQAAADTFNEVEAADAETVTLRSGLRLRLKPVPAWLVQKAATSIPKPSVPRVHIEDQDRWEDNPADPGYATDLAMWEAKTIEAGINVLLSMGTEIDALPDGMEPPDSDGWLDVVRYLGVELDSDLPIARYLTWLLCYALAEVEDFQQVVVAAQRRAGLAEEDAAQALASFRNRTQRRANNGASAKAP